MSNPDLLGPYEAKLIVRVDSLQTDTLSFDKTNGKKRRLILTGNIDDPYQGPSGDFWDSEAASCLSFKPIERELPRQCSGRELLQSAQARADTASDLQDQGRSPTGCVRLHRDVL